MKEDTWGLVEITDPEKLKELNKPFVSQGYQKFRDDILRMLKYLSCLFIRVLSSTK
jgi:hypothetical protein